MAYQWSGSMRQHRAATEPTPSKSAIPPSLIPGHRHHTFSATGTNNLTNVLCFDPSTSNNPRVKAPATAGGDTQDGFSMNPSPYYRDFQLPPPPHLMPQSLPPQSVVPPLPPKAPFIPFINPHTTTAILPPKPPPPPSIPPPLVLPRSQSQPLMPPPPPPPPPPLQSTPPPPTLPLKPVGARSRSIGVTRSPGPHPPARPHVSLSASSIVREPNEPSAKSPTERSPTESSLGMNEEQEFALALELSKQAERERADALRRAQEDDIAQAMRQSLIDSATRPGPSGSRPGPSTLDNDNVPSSSSTIPRDAHPRSPKPVSRNVTLSAVEEQLKKDEMLARELKAKFDSEHPTPSQETNQRVDPQPSEGPPLPLYKDIVGRATAPVNHLESDESTSPHVPQVQLNSTRSRERLSNPDQADTPPRNTPSPAQRTSPRPESQITTASQEETVTPEHSPTSPQPQPQPPRSVVTPNQFVERELLYGASFGNHTPPVQNVQFRGGLPHALALPYGKGQAMHIRATSWRQLLKLLAKLSATQIEPSIEARAATKGKLYLRTVIQFFKPNPASAEWRTVIYLSIDYPPPPDHRSINGVVNSLPYSYSLSPIPPLLRDGSDSALSKYYTIPSTSRTPWPELPVTMPNMANYLMEAVEDSRRARGDTIAGHRRLAKMINQFYPTRRARVPDEEDEEEPRGRGRALIGRLMGRQSKPPQGGGHNADMYDVVTPFISEWG